MVSAGVKTLLLVVYAVDWCSPSVAQWNLVNALKPSLHEKYPELQVEQKPPAENHHPGNWAVFADGREVAHRAAGNQTALDAFLATHLTPRAPATHKPAATLVCTPPSNAAAAVVMGLNVLCGHADLNLPLVSSKADKAYALGVAASVGDTASLAAMLGAWPGSGNEADALPAGNTPLHYAALFQQRPAVAMLLTQHVNPDPENPVKTRPIHDAARAGDAAIVGLLAGYHVDMTTPNEYGDTLIHRIALHCGASSQAAFIATTDACLRGLTAEKRAALLGQTNVPGFTAFDIAAARDMPELAKHLAALGATHSVLYSSGKWTLDDIMHAELWQKRRAQLLEQR